MAKTTGHYDSSIDLQVDHYILSVPPPPPPFLLQTCYIQVKIVLQLVPKLPQMASEDIKQNVWMYV